MALSVALLIAGQSFAQNEIGGTINYHYKNNKPIPSVTITLYDSDGDPVASALSGLDGSYLFTEVSEGNYTLQASTTIMAGGVNMADANKIKHHLNGIKPLEGIEWEAADVNSDGDVNWDDYDAIVAWHMQGINFNEENPWIFDIVNDIDVTNNDLKARTNVPTMGGSSSGDVNGTFVPTTRNLAETIAKYTEKPITDNFSVEIFATDITEASAMGLIINYPANMVNISDITSQLGEVMTFIKNGQIRIGWINESAYATPVNSDLPILTIIGETTINYDGSDIKFKVDPTSHFCDASSNELETRYSLPLLTSSENYLGKNYPNPFVGSTTIDYSVPADVKINISLYNQMGQMVRVLADKYENTGIHSLTISSEGLEPGIYFYTLRTNGSIFINETKRMVITR